MDCEIHAFGQNGLSIFSCPDTHNFLNHVLCIDADIFSGQRITCLFTDRLQRLTNPTPPVADFLLAYTTAHPQVPIGEDTSLVLKASVSGSLCAMQQVEGQWVPATALSETEERLFRYHCFLYRYAFWQAFDRQNGVTMSKPIVLTDFVERLDQKVNLRRELACATALGVSVILVISVQNDRQALLHRIL